MHQRYEPPSDSVGPVEFRPFMLEVAWDYCQTMLCSQHQRGMIIQTIGALAVEIVLKSFNSNVSGNAGQLNETYDFDKTVLPPKATRSDAHNLKILSDALRNDVRAYLLDRFDIDMLIEHKNTFTDSRYHYERASPTWSSDDILTLAVKLICAAIYLYKQKGCSDPFITSFNVDTTYYKYVQKVILTPPCEV